MSPARFRAMSIATLLLTLGIVACSLPTDERVSPYNPADLPGNLTNTTTTSTTTTTTTVPFVPGSLPNIETTTTSVPAALTSPVELFYTIGFSDEMRPLRREFPDRVTIGEVLGQLETPFPDVLSFGLRSSVRPGLVQEVQLERATATVALDLGVLGRLTNDEQRRATAQIVLTLTSFVTADEGAIGFVRFEADGDGFPVFVPSLGGNSDPGEPLAFVDFASLVLETSLSPTDTTTTTSSATTSTTTTQPTDDTSPDA